MSYSLMPDLEINMDGTTPRSCGDCGLCCKLLPVTSIQKPRNFWCTHFQHGKGCAIYHARPTDCRLWSCKWVLDVKMPEEAKPDRSHVVFDCMLDTMTMDSGDGPQSHPVAQAWCDPLFPDAWRDPAVLREMDRIAEQQGVATMVRISIAATVAVAPRLSGRADWLYIESQLTPDANQEWERPLLPPGAMP